MVCVQTMSSPVDCYTLPLHVDVCSLFNQQTSLREYPLQLLSCFWVFLAVSKVQLNALNCQVLKKLIQYCLMFAPGAAGIDGFDCSTCS